MKRATVVDVKEIKVCPNLVFFDGTDYFMGFNPGIAMAPLAYAWGVSVSQANIKLNGWVPQAVSWRPSPSDRLSKVTDRVLTANKMKSANAYGTKLFQTALLKNDNLAYVDGDFFLARDCSQWLDGLSELELLLIFNNQSGEVLKDLDSDIKYLIHSREGTQHNKPHVHIEYQHKYKASVSIEDGLLISGELPIHVLSRARKRIEEKQEILMRYWNDCTDGIRYDPNVALGGSVVRRRENV